jgi:hypothetical protein
LLPAPSSTATNVEKVQNKLSKLTKLDFDDKGRLLKLIRWNVLPAMADIANAVSSMVETLATSPE